MLLLNRYYAAKKNEGKDIGRRPYLASECDDIKKAEKWRGEISREIGKKVTQIQNPGLGEFRIRDLNDEINKLLREKGHWERRIMELGGPKYRLKGRHIFDKDGKEVPGARGYKYFGAARDLPGVRELFQQEPPKPKRKTRSELSKNVDADYYGYRDDDDGVLAPIEADIEKQARMQSVAKWKELRDSGKINDVEEEDIYSKGPPPDSLREGEEEESMDQEETVAEKEGEESRFIAHVPVPSQEEVEEMLIQRKKQQLLETYASEALQQQSLEARTLLGLQ